MSGRIALAVQALLRIGAVRWLAARLVRSTGALAGIARGYAMLNPELAGEVGLRASCVLEVDPPTPSPGEDLDLIPSETTAAERRFLYTFFAHLWGGDANVVEVGPFLGGTSRAIALGMLANPSRSPGSRLYTYDRFDDYYEPDRLLDYLAPLFAAGLLGERERAVVAAGARFDGVFDAIHRGTTYGDLVVPRDRPLPDAPGQSEEGLFELDPGIEFDAVFVDGCKSWYGTKYFMRRVLEATRARSHVIFQDYGWHTCFWIPAFAYAMGDSLTLTARVDTTSAFHLSGRLSGSDVDDRYPDRAEDLGRSWFDDAFGSLAAGAVERGDLGGAVVLRLQHAGAVAYLGDLEAARELIQALRREVGWWGPNRYMIERARRSPTFRAGSDPILL